MNKQSIETALGLLFITDNYEEDYSMLELERDGKRTLEMKVPRHAGKALLDSINIKIKDAYNKHHYIQPMYTLMKEAVELALTAKAKPIEQEGEIPKPPIGLMPRDIHENNRINAIFAAVERYHDAKMDIPVEWMKELEDLTEENSSIDGL